MKNGDACKTAGEMLVKADTQAEYCRHIQMPIKATLLTDLTV
jgi:hypothetical protein